MIGYNEGKESSLLCPAIQQWRSQALTLSLESFDGQEAAISVAPLCESYSSCLLCVHFSDHCSGDAKQSEDEEEEKAVLSREKMEHSPWDPSWFEQLMRWISGQSEGVSSRQMRANWKVWLICSSLYTMNGTVFWENSKPCFVEHRSRQNGNYLRQHFCFLYFYGKAAIEKEREKATHCVRSEWIKWIRTKAIIWDYLISCLQWEK